MNTDKLVFFDFDGTLFDSNKYFFVAIDETLNELGFDSPDRNIVKPLLSTNFPTFLEGLKKLYPKMDMQEFQAVLEPKDVENMKKHGKLYENTIPTLEAIYQQGFQMAICTNRGQKSIDLCADFFKIRKYFVEIKGNDESIEKYFLVEDSLKKFQPKQAWFVGDGPHDELAAEKSNIPFIWAEYGFGAEKVGNKKLSIKTIDEVLEFLK